MPTEEGGQGGEAIAPGEEAPAPEPQAPKSRAKKPAKNRRAKLEGRRLYLSKDVHFRLRMLAYQRGKNLSEMAEEVLDKNLPRYDVNRIG